MNDEIRSSGWRFVLDRHCAPCRRSVISHNFETPQVTHGLRDSRAELSGSPIEMARAGLGSYCSFKMG